MRHFLFFAALLLAGCAAVPERPPVGEPDQVWHARAAALRRVNEWDVRGRLALRSAEEGFHASLRWVREAERHRIDLTGPLGGGHVRLTQDRSGAEFRDANDRVYRDTSVRNLLWRRTGWDLPIEGLNFWLLGLPAPDAPAQHEIDAWGRLKSLEQFGWEVRFVEYVQLGASELPSRIFIRRRSEAAADRTLEVRLVVEEWLQVGERSR